MGFLDGRIDLAFRRTVGNMNASLIGFGFALVFRGIGDEGSLDFIGMKEPRLLTVGLVDIILVGIGTNS